MMTSFPQQLQPVSAIGLGLVIFSAFCLLLFLFTAFKLQRAATQASMTRKLLRDQEHQRASLEQENGQLRIQTVRLSTQLAGERKAHSEKLQLLDEARRHLSLQFQQLAQRIFEEKSATFNSESRERLTDLLAPFQEQLRSFRTRIDAIQENDIRERSSLKSELHQLREMNQQLNKEAINLTRALKGEQKTQGMWGELVLETILEKSGLRKGEEYITQTSFRNADNRLLRPDVIVHLPGERSIIIDSKVSLSAWERYTGCDDTSEKERHLAEHLISLRRHIKGLSEKHYPDIRGANSLDFVLLFIPIDASFTVASESAPQLFEEAYGQHIIIVTPTTLLVTLRTIDNLWRQERQNSNAREIAETAGTLHDTICRVLEEMEKLGRQLATCTATYETAMGRLTRGRGNLVAQANRLTELGAPTKKEIPASIDQQQSGSV